MKHTPGPFYAEDDLTIRVKEWKNCTQMGDYRGCVIADLKPALGAECEENILIARPHALSETKANLNFIVRACNSHDDLLTACESARLILESQDTMFAPAIRDRAIETLEQLNEAIDRARGEK